MFTFLAVSSEGPMTVGVLVVKKSRLLLLSSMLRLRRVDFYGAAGEGFFSGFKLGI